MRAVLEKCLLAVAVNGVYRWQEGRARRVLDGGVAEAGKRRASTRPDIGSISTFYSGQASVSLPRLGWLLRDVEHLQSQLFVSAMTQPSRTCAALCWAGTPALPTPNFPRISPPSHYVQLGPQPQCGVSFTRLTKWASSIRYLPVHPSDVNRRGGCPSRRPCCQTRYGAPNPAIAPSSPTVPSQPPADPQFPALHLSMRTPYITNSSCASSFSCSL